MGTPPVQANTHSAPVETLTMFTFDDLAAEIASAATSAQEKGSWDRLLAVVDDLASGRADDTSFDPVSGRKWSLLSVSVRGYRGVLNDADLTIDFDPSPGITVLHGPNGAGKSSISDAIEAALTGTTPVSRAGKGGNLPLWEPVPMGRNVVSACTRVTLQSGQERLHLSLLVSADSADQTWTCELESNGARIPVTPGPGWSNALASHRPVFAYATLERRVQLSKDLATYFEGLLALGGAFTALEAEISKLAAETKRAYDEWHLSLKAALTALEEIDELRSTGDEADLGPITTPGVSDDIEAWVNLNHLSLTGPSTGAIPSSAASSLLAAADEFDSAHGSLTEAGQSFVDRLAPALAQLHGHASELGGESEHCPVCNTATTEWRNQLATTIARLESLKGFQTRAVQQLQALRDCIDLALRPVLAVAVDPADALDLHRESLTGLRLLGDFDATISAHGTQHHHLVLRSAAALSQWLRSEGGQRLVAFAATQADRRRQWGLARAEVSIDFITLWRESQETASQALDWKATNDRVETLRKRLRSRRTSVLQTRASLSVQDLLSDVGLSINGLAVQTTKATMQLTDPQGHEMELGMLSAGQRNAVLLAPLLASIESGPFGFVVLDDPVHAFDQLRIDRLAKALSVLAADRRVVVLTHDERLREHLMAQPISCDSRVVSRSIQDGSVTVSDSDHFWDRLLQDAQIILEMNVKVSETTLTVTDTVRGLCRQALDSAIRQMVLRDAIHRGSDVGGELAALDELDTTKKRLKYAESLPAPDAAQVHPAAEAARHCKPFLVGWNQASHGNPAESAAEVAEITAAREACSALTRGPSMTEIQ